MAQKYVSFYLMSKGFLEYSLFGSNDKDDAIDFLSYVHGGNLAEAIAKYKDPSAEVLYLGTIARKQRISLNTFDFKSIRFSSHSLDKTPNLGEVSDQFLSDIGKKVAEILSGEPSKPL